MKPRLLDLFCGAGGAAMGYHRAGFEVVGVDIARQPHYPFEFHRADALDFLSRTGGFDAVHASPPCQHWSRAQQHGLTYETGHLLSATRAALVEFGRPWVIENVPGAYMRPDYRLCGCMFGLPGLRRERWFETSWVDWQRFRAKHRHVGRTVTVAGHPGRRSTRDGYGNGTTAEWRAAMDIDWMTNREMAQAIPPAFTQMIGGRLLDQIRSAESAAG